MHQMMRIRKYNHEMIKSSQVTIHTSLEVTHPKEELDKIEILAQS